MSNVKYIVELNGQPMSLKKYATATGKSYKSLRHRVVLGLDLDTPIAPRWRPKINPAESYTYKEIRELYKNFAGQQDELRMLMDFTDLPKGDAKFLLENLKKDIGGKAS